MIKKVYAVVEDYANEYGDCGLDINVFSTYEKASDYLIKCVLDNLEFLDVEKERIVTTVSRGFYEVFEEGYWSGNHYQAYIKKKEVC